MEKSLNLEKVDLTLIKAIGHNGTSLQILIEKDNNYYIESLPAPEQAFRGIQQLAQFVNLVFATGSTTASKNQLLDAVEMLAVNSSNIAAIGYSEVYRVLQVDFLNGAKYRYFDVPSQIFEDFLDAPSKGRFLNNVIKSQYGFKYEQIV